MQKSIIIIIIIFKINIWGRWFTWFPFRFDRACTVASWAKETLLKSYKIYWPCPNRFWCVSYAYVLQELETQKTREFAELRCNTYLPTCTLKGGHAGIIEYKLLEHVFVIHQLLLLLLFFYYNTNNVPLAWYIMQVVSQGSYFVLICTDETVFMGLANP